MKTAHFEVLRDVAMATVLASYIWGAHWRHLAIMTEPSVCDGNAALCQITLTTCYLCCIFAVNRHFPVSSNSSSVVSVWGGEVSPSIH